MQASPQQAERIHRFAHDLRNRLIGLQQVLHQLKDIAAGEDAAELALYGEQQYFKALREVERLMDDLGVQRGTVTPQLAPVDMAGLIRQRIDLMSFRFERKQQIITADPQEAVVMADERLIGDLVDALLSNASKFSPAGAAVRIDARSTGASYTVSLQDSGAGLNAADLEQAFTRFAWLQSRPTAGEAQGRGTLARAREWARAHGGELEAYSAGEGRGCTFTLTLPLRSA